MFVLFLRATPVLTLCLAATATLSAEVRSAAELLPESAVVYGELADPGQVLRTILEHPLRNRLEKMAPYQEVLQSEEYLPLKAAVRILEKEVGKTWPEILSSATAGGLAVAFDLETNGFIVLVKADEPKTLEKLHEVLLTVVRGTTQLQGKADPIQTSSYRGVQVHAFDHLKFGIVREWLVLTDQGRLGQFAVDRLLGDAGNDLAKSQRFQLARQQLPNEPSGWAFVDVETLRKRGVAEDIFRGRSENPLVELALGGVLSNLQHTPLATAALEVETQFLRLTMATPHDASWVEASRSFYFGPRGTGVAPGLLTPADTVLTLSTYRDLAGLWLHADDLFDQGVNDGFAQAESGLSTLFSGKDFGEEVLGALRPEIQVVVTRQSFGDRLPQPAIKLPAFAAVLRLKQPAAMRDDFRRTFQSLMGFLNVVGAMNAQPQLDFFVQKDATQQILTSSFVAEDDQQQSRQAPIHFNFSPAVALVEDRMVLSSDTELARHLSDGPVAETDNVVNTQARLNAHMLHEILADNRSQLIAQNMLEEGNSKAEAAREIDGLLEILRFFAQASLQLETRDETLQLQLQLDFNISGS